MGTEDPHKAQLTTQNSCKPLNSLKKDFNSAGRIFCKFSLKGSFDLKKLRKHFEKNLDHVTY